ncbi:MAG: Na+/H+ antiporter subunit E [Acidimicrobiia bacterium]|nr:Na+/H+ antiporter subunit E [Acidimicrobiia bacterium]
MSFVEVLGATVMGIGVALSLIAAWGLLSFPTALARMHAAGKPASLGLSLTGLGAGLAAESVSLTVLGAMLAFFMFLTAPISAHMLGRAAYQAGQAPNLHHDDLAGVTIPVDVAPQPGERSISGWHLIPLVIIWVVLWRDAGVGVWIGGLLAGLFVEVIRRTGRPNGTFSPGAMVVFLVRYSGMIVASNARVAWEVISPGNQIREAIVAVPLRTDSLRVALLVSNAITHTPGTLTVELTEDPLVVYVHLLHFKSVAAARDDVARLEELVCRALNEPVPV